MNKNYVGYIKHYMEGLKHGSYKVQYCFRQLLYGNFFPSSGEFNYSDYKKYTSLSEIQYEVYTFE